MNSENKDEIVYIYLDDIIPNRFQPREIFDEKALKELALSIKEHGVIQPIIVRKVNDKYEIIAGERRYKATALAGLTKIPAIVRNLDDKESSKVALLENLQRKNLNPIEEARTYKKILEIDEMTQEELAKTMGKSQSSVANKIRLLALSEQVQDALLKEQISERHARTLLNITDPKLQAQMLKKVIDNKMSVRKLEEEISNNQENNEEGGTNMDLNENTIKPNFINNSPLVPTAEIPEEKSEYGKVKIVPPEGSSMEHVPKFINYGEVDKEEETNTFTPNDLVTPIDPNNMIKNSNNINNEQSSSADLDNLLNINKNFNYVSSGIKNKSSKSGINSNSKDISDGNSGEYFENPDLKSMDLTNDINYNQAILNNKVDTTTNLTFASANDANIEQSYSLDEFVNKIQKIVDDYNSHGLNINFDKFKFSKSTQLMIKIEE